MGALDPCPAKVVLTRKDGSYTVLACERLTHDHSGGGVHLVRFNERLVCWNG